ncbi:MAG: hypothetical protein HUJ26_05020 [Planctomycetaceae bacterium]|nr:hypothetical protein [Planctomycetaceae bacterium]
MTNFNKFFLLCLATMIPVGLAGCGSDETSQETVQAPASPNAPDSPMPGDEMAAGGGAGYGGGEYGGGGQPGGGRPPKSVSQTPPPPPRPEDVNDWTSQHITSAIEERDVKVKEALAIYRDAHRGDDASAQEVVAWMQILQQPPKEPPKRNPNRSNPGGAGYPGGYPGGPGGPGGEYAGGGEPGYPGGEPGYPGGEPGAYPGGPEAPGMEPPGGPGGEYAGGEYAGGEYPGGEYPGGEMYGEPGMYGGPGMGGPGKPNTEEATDEIAEALIDSLLGIQSLTGYQAARDLLEGNIPLPIDAEHTARHTLTALLKNIQSIHDPATKILRQSMLEPEVLRSQSGDFDSRRLRNVAYEEHWKNALAVMDGVMGVSTSELNPSKPQSNNNMYGEYGEGMGYPGGPGGPGEPGAYPEPGPGPGNQAGANKEETLSRSPLPENLRLPDYTQEQASTARYYVWSPEMVEEVTNRVKVSDTLMREPEVILMAGQLPATSSRDALQKFLTKNWMISDDWTRNAVDLVKHNVFKGYMRDPGLLITLKSLPREQVAGNANGGGGYGAPGAPGGEYGGEAPGGRPANRGSNPANQKETQAKGEWFTASEQMMLGLMDRMHRAAHNRALSEHNPDELDVRLHRNAVVTLDSRLEVVRDEMSQDPEDPMPDKTTVNYVRIELDNLTPQEGEKIVKHYISSLRGEKVNTILGNNGMWMETSQKNRLKKQLISTDVLLSRNGIRKPIVSAKENQRGPGGQPGAEAYGGNEQYAPPGGPGGEYGGPGGGQGGFVVEILTVRIPDPEEFLKPAEEYVSKK